MRLEVKIEHRLTEVEERSKSNQHRLDELEKRQDNLDKLVSTVEVLAVREKNVEDSVEEIKADVKLLTNKSGQRWDSLVEKAVWAVVAAFIGFVLAQIGL